MWWVLACEVDGQIKAIGAVAWEMTEPGVTRCLISSMDGLPVVKMLEKY